MKNSLFFPGRLLHAQTVNLELAGSNVVQNNYAIIDSYDKMMGIYSKVLNFRRCKEILFVFRIGVYKRESAKISYSA